MAVAANSIGASGACRLCGGELVFAFKHVVLGCYDVGYFRCETCRSLQTETPYWLGEAYSNPSTGLDPGAVQRSLNNFALTFVICGIFGFNRILDYGGGLGLLCRLLRDAHKDAYWFDRYSPPGYAAGFNASPQQKFDLITAFELIEHLQNPAIDLDEIFASAPAAVLVSTELYSDQKKDWWYLAPIEGQHVFFYSAQALPRIADHYGYLLHFGRGYQLFTRAPIGMAKHAVLKWLVRPSVIRWFRGCALTLDHRGALQDFELLSRRMKERRSS
jgi:2-polyprenyl-3-methyl-5-hydroxy-6-metoxy-1,4-benzoquinol methylase